MLSRRLLTRTLGIDARSVQVDRVDLVDSTHEHPPAGEDLRRALRSNSPDAWDVARRVAGKGSEVAPLTRLDGVAVATSATA